MLGPQTLILIGIVAGIIGAAVDEWRKMGVCIAILFVLSGAIIITAKLLLQRHWEKVKEQSR